MLGIAAAIGMVVALSPAVSAPIVQKVSGTMDHKGTITITGAGFGAKATAAPLAWDDATGGNMLDKWDGAWPYLAPAGYNIGYYSPIRGVNPPHSHDSRYIAGAHAGSTWKTGYDVMFFKNIDLKPFPFYVYASWYQRADTNWQFTTAFPYNNYKTFAYSICCSPYEMPNNWFTAYGPPEPSSNKAADSPMWVFTDDGHSLQNPDVNGHNAWWGHGVNPISGQWTKVEVALKLTNQTNGYIKIWEDGRQVMDYAGPTDKYPGTQRTIGIGGYSYPYNHPENWRYFADAYLDLSLSRVVLANNPVLSKATVIENQIPTQWNDASITATVNLGHFATGDTAYLFVLDSSGTPNATGLAVTAGGVLTTAGGAPAPLPPSGVLVK